LVAKKNKKKQKRGSPFQVASFSSITSTN